MADTVRYGLSFGIKGRKPFRCFFGNNANCPDKREVKLFGLTDLIKKHFFHKKWSQMAISGATSEDNVKGGSERGRKVDQEITKWHRLKSNPKTKQFTLDKYRLKCDRYTNKILDAIESKGWTILSTQLAVGHVDSRVGTAVDIKVRDRKGRVLIIEVKSGYNGVFDAEFPSEKEWAWCTGNMKKYPANAKIYALIQLLWTWLLHNNSAPVKADMAFVLNVSDAGVKFHKPSEEFVDLVLPRIMSIQKERARRFCRQ